MRDFTINLIIALVCIALVLLIGRLFIAGIDSQAEYQCKKWQSYSEQYPQWYATSGQVEQCEYYSIEL